MIIIMNKISSLFLYAFFSLGLCIALILPFETFATETPAQTSPKIVDPNADQWFVRCDDKEKSKKQCEVFQRLIVAKNNQRLVEFAVAYVGDQKEPYGTVIIPLGTLVQQGLEIRVDDQQPIKNSIRYCTADGCFAHFDLDEKFINAMKKGKKVVVTFVLAAPKKLNVELSLKGFSKAVDKLKKS